MTTSTSTSLCEIKHVTHEFPQPNGTPLRVLDDITFEVRPNEVVALLGPSGCGKSTILRILAGLISPTTGSVVYHGAPLHGLNPGAAIVFQSFALFPWMTVTENVESVLKAARMDAEDIRERASKAIRTVGLVGFEEAYPRELSGGMKQRVGMARALSLNPEMLFMDEPFSQVDALTAESLRAEVLDLWAAKETNPCSILMVSHDITEVVYMADRIVVLAANPGKVRTIIENPLPRPRDYRSAELLELVEQLHDVITGTEMPDVKVTGTRATPVIEPLPNATASEIIGLLEYIGARGGRNDVVHIAADTDRELGDVINIVRAAELLQFVDTPKRMVVLTRRGIELVRASTEDRSAVWREQLRKLGLFQRIEEAIQRQEELHMTRELVLETIAMMLPCENYERMFETFVRWGRFGDLFAYDENTELLTLQRATDANQPDT